MGVIATNSITITSINDGAPATSYHLSVSAYAIVKKQDDTYSPATITLTSKSQTGDNPIDNYSGRFKIEETTNGTTWTTKYTSVSNEYTKIHTPSANIRAIRCSLYLAGGTSTPLDQQTIPVVSDGENGNDAYTVMLSNESHSFQGNTTTAVSGSVATKVIAYKGTTQVAATIGDITGLPQGMTQSISNNNSVNASITFAVTTKMVSKSGVVTIPITVDGKTFQKQFSYSLSLAPVNGTSSYTFIRYSSTESPHNDMYDTPKEDSIYIGTCVTSINSAPTTPSSYTWAKFKSPSPLSLKISATNGTSFSNDNKTVELIASGYSGETAVTGTYKWYKNGTAINGATSAKYSILCTGFSIYTNFKCEMTYNSVTVSDSITITNTVPVLYGKTNPYTSGTIYTGDIWVDTSTDPYTYKRYNGTSWATITKTQYYEYVGYGSGQITEFFTTKINETANNITLLSSQVSTDNEAINSKYAALEQTANGLSSEVSSVKAQYGEISTELSATKTLAEQTSDKFSWIVKSGNSESSMVLTDKMYKLIADNIDLTGKVTLSSIVDGSGQTIIDGGKIKSDFLSLKGITVYGADGSTETFKVTSTGEVSMNVSSFTVKSQSIEQISDASANQVWESSKSIMDTLTNKISDVNNDIDNLKNDSDAIKNDFGTLNQYVSSQLTVIQDAGMWQANFQKFKEDVERYQSSNDSSLETFYSYIRFVDGNIELGDSDNALKLIIEPDQISFWQNGAKVAYITNQEMCNTICNIIDRLKIGNSAWIVESNANGDEVISWAVA